MMRNVNEVMFTNSYLLFFKLMRCKKEKEPLNECMESTFTQFGLTAEDYRYMGSSVSGYVFGKNSEKCYTSLVAEIKKIYCSGKHTVLNRNFDQSILLEEVEYRGYLYSFLVDRHVSKNVVILLDFYTQEERKTEDILFTSIDGVSHLQRNKAVHYRKIMGGKYCIINTYNAFCSFAHVKNENLHIGLNAPFFNEFFEENLWKFQEGVLGISKEQNRMDDFNYVKFGNMIVIFNYNVNKFYRNNGAKVRYNIHRYYTGSQQSEVAIPRSVACAKHRYNVVNVKNVELKNVV